MTKQRGKPLQYPRNSFEYITAPGYLEPPLCFSPWIQNNFLLSIVQTKGDINTKLRWKRNLWTDRKSQTSKLVVVKEKLLVHNKAIRAFSHEKKKGLLDITAGFILKLTYEHLEVFSMYLKNAFKVETHFIHVLYEGPTI